MKIIILFVIVFISSFCIAKNIPEVPLELSFIKEWRVPIKTLKRKCSGNGYYIYNWKGKNRWLVIPVINNKGDLIKCK